ncbi:MAG: hypothetical protein HY814_07135 [Candidatus Riflebacteria bacterium]|nr:hypothetical protein [Candidatus Riflebacteria bacterium]
MRRLTLAAVTAVTTMTLLAGAPAVQARDDALSALRYRALSSQNPKVKEALQVLDSEGLLTPPAPEERPAGDAGKDTQLLPADVVNAIYWFEYLQGGQVLGVLPAYDERQQAEAKHLLWARYSQDGTGVLAVDETAVDAVVGAAFSAPVGLATAGSDVGLVAYYVYRVSADGTQYVGTLAANGYDLGAWDQVYLWDTWVDRRRGTGVVVYSGLDGRPMMAELPLLSASKKTARKALDPRPSPNARSLSTEEYEKLRAENATSAAGSIAGSLPQSRAATRPATPVNPGPGLVSPVIPRH